MKSWLMILSVMPLAAAAAGDETIDYRVRNSSAPEVRTVISPSGRVDTYQGTGRSSSGAVTGSPAERTHSVTEPGGATVYHRGTGNNTIVNEPGHVDRGTGMGSSGGRPQQRKEDD